MTSFSQWRLEWTKTVVDGENPKRYGPSLGPPVVEDLSSALLPFLFLGRIPLLK